VLCQVIRRLQGRVLLPARSGFRAQSNEGDSIMTTKSERSCCASDCCSGEASAPSSAPVQDAQTIRETVRQGYAKIAESGAWPGTAPEPKAAGCCGGGSSGGGCCGPSSMTSEQIAQAVGYGSQDLANLPEGANMGLSCGNPTALASLKPGEVVLDLGSGGGFDCFIAGPKVGERGRIVGVDMTPEMIGKARRNLVSYREQAGLNNVEFRLGEIENLPVADKSVDVVISNCVINLSPDKPRVWSEIARVLRPEGRVAISDLALLKPLPEGVLKQVEALVGCVAGASLVSDIEQMAAAAGFTDIRVERKPGYVDAMTSWEDPLYKQIIAALPKGSRIGDYVTSVDISAVKPVEVPW
jgi:arsenite methyltransferase